MTVAEALTRMELVGHEFFLFHDVDSDLPSVVYRRRGWSYGVLRLTAEGEAAAALHSDAEQPDPRSQEDPAGLAS